MDGWELFPGVAALLLVSAFAYVAGRGLVAQRRGEDVGRATIGAMWVVGPPLFLAVVGLVLLALLAVVTAVVLFFIVFSEVVGGDLDTGSLILVLIVGLVLLFLAVVGAVLWGLVRVIRNHR